MRKANLTHLILIFLTILVVTTPGLAALREAYVGDVLVVAWLDDQVMKVALANDSMSRKSITLASAGRDQRWQPYFYERTVVVPARTVVVEAFRLSSNWRGEPLEIEATAWERRAVIEVQTSEIFKPKSYVVRAQEEVEVEVDLGFILEGHGPLRLTVDEYYRGWGTAESGRIQVMSVEGGFRQGRLRNSIEFVNPHMILSMRAPNPRGDSTVFTFSLYQQREGGHWNYHQDEVQGPTILVYSRNLQLRDNSHLSEPPSPSWEWRYNQ